MEPSDHYFTCSWSADIDESPLLARSRGDVAAWSTSLRWPDLLTDRDAGGVKMAERMDVGSCGNADLEAPRVL
jgi:hypothetical protein